jgi:sulfur-carrier protein
MIILKRMAKYKVKAFGITKDIVGGRETVIEVEEQTVAALRTALQKKYPSLTSLRSLFIAVNNDYAEDTAAIRENDEIALIPPVSGG